MGLTIAIFCIAAVLSILAAIMAFLITYEEYVHHYPNKTEVLKTALKAAGFTLVFFLALGLLLAIILPFCFYREH
jgi:purine-cytosine permease-like protein